MNRDDSTLRGLFSYPWGIARLSSREVMVVGPVVAPVGWTTVVAKTSSPSSSPKLPSFVRPQSRALRPL